MSFEKERDKLKLITVVIYIAVFLILLLVSFILNDGRFIMAFPLLLYLGSILKLDFTALYQNIFMIISVHLKLIAMYTGFLLLYQQFYVKLF